MIINALKKYYEILAEDPESDIPKEGYSNTKVSAALVISKEGELINIISLKVDNEKSKKLISRNIIVPEYTQPTSGILANFLCGSSSYVLGIGDLKNPERSKKCFIEFKKKHNEILKNASTVPAKAILLFLNKWNVEKAAENIVVSSSNELLYEGGNIVFFLQAEGYIHEDTEIKKLWEEFKFRKSNDIYMQCLVSGEKSPIAELHLNKIKGIRNAQMAGASIVSFNAPAYESYGKTQSYNSPISKYSAFAYTTVLNHMLSNQKQKIQIGDATTVFWAESLSDIYTNFAMQLFNPTTSEEKEKTIRDIKTEKTIADILKSAKEGKGIPNNIDAEVNPSTKFHILGLSPNASRISVRFFHADTFGSFVEKTVQHYKDMQITKDFENRPDNIPIWQILRETVSPKSSDKEAQPLLAGAIMRAILDGGLYPQSLYTSIIRRVKMDCDEVVNFYVRASIIKAYLLRKARITNNERMKEVLTVALNEQTTDTAYLLGRLFAILEKTQKDAGNETIRARYFASAMSTPRAVFPILLRLAQHHISKSEYGHINDRKIESIMNNIEQIPSHLSLDQQGAFILGYYQQRPKLWEKQIKENFKEEN